MDSKDLMKLYRKGNAEQYSVLVIDITLPSKNDLNCQKSLLDELYNVVMTVDEKITFQYDIKRVATKISALSSGKIGRYEHRDIAFTIA